MRGLHRLRRTTLVPLAVGVALALAASACGTGNDNNNGGGNGGGSASTPGVTDTEILLGSHQPLTGPAAPGYSKIAPSAEAMFKYINDNGGINGRKITLKYLDDTYDPTKTVNVVRKLILEEKVFALMGGLGTPTHSKVLDYVNQQKVPDLFVASGASKWGDTPDKYPYTFGFQPSYTIEGKVLGQYLKQNFAGKKVGYMLQDDDFGGDFARGLDMYVDQSSVVAREKYTSGNTNIGPQVSNLKAKGAEVVVCACIPAYAALTILGKLKIGYNAQMVLSNVGADVPTLSGLLESFAKQGGATVKGTDLIEGVISDAYLAPIYAEDNSWIQLFKKVHDKYVPSLTWDGNVVYGMSQAYMMAQALTRAGKDLTRDKLLAAVEQGGFEGPGLVSTAYSKTTHAGYSGVQVVKISGGKGNLLGTPMLTDGAAGPINAYTKQQPAAPSNGIPNA
jgi:ABC-type branched-subunit amino acid transport system substrate-binding protein